MIVLRRNDLRLVHKKSARKTIFERFFDIYRIILVPQFGVTQVRYWIFKDKVLGL
jgi:hypothetical protein